MGEERVEKSEKTPFYQVFISARTSQIVLKFSPLPGGQQFPSQGQSCHQGLLCWGESFHSRISHGAGIPARNPGTAFFKKQELSSSAAVGSTQ